jgi:predicted metal-binding membrane protein
VSSAPEPAAAARERALERLLRHERAITIAGLVALVALAWAWLFAGAGMATPATMPSMPGMPGMSGMTKPPDTWSSATWVLMLAMWWTMMVAMMTPSATPTILLYARVHRHSASQAHGMGGSAPTGAFAAGYLLLWLAFALAATVVQFGLERAGVLPAGSLASRSRWLSAGVLLFAGAYQLSPFKNACLAHCRAPAAFLSQHWRPGAAGALRLGVLHGAYCIGCCWLLMALLFVVGVMNLAWIAALTALVLAEKLLPGGVWLGRAAGLLLLAWAAFLLTGAGA